VKNEYLIPANTKKSQLILGFFTPVDLIVFLVGASLSFIMLLLIKSLSVKLIILILLPALIGTFLVLPIPHYHNVMQLLINIFNYYSGVRRYFWKGWCANEKFK